MIGKLSRKLMKVADMNSDHGLVFAHYCPGCKAPHFFHLTKPNASGAKWHWNGDIEQPTFEPSMNINRGYCHYYIKWGKIEFLSDCHHELKGQHVVLPDIPDDYDAETIRQDYLDPILK